MSLEKKLDFWTSFTSRVHEVQVGVTIVPISTDLLLLVLTRRHQKKRKSIDFFILLEWVSRFSILLHVVLCFIKYDCLRLLSVTHHHKTCSCYKACWRNKYNTWATPVRDYITRKHIDIIANFFLCYFTILNLQFDLSRRFSDHGFVCLLVYVFF